MVGPQHDHRMPVTSTAVSANLAWLRSASIKSGVVFVSFVSLLLLTVGIHESAIFPGQSQATARPVAENFQGPKNPAMGNIVTEIVNELWKDCKENAACVKERLEKYIQTNQPLLAMNPALRAELLGAARRVGERTLPRRPFKAPTDHELKKVKAANPDLIKRVGSIMIAVNFHVIHDRTQGKLDPSALEAQIKVLNVAYQDHGIRFVIKNAEWVENEAWFNLETRSANERQMKKALTREPRESLNLYFTRTRYALDWATFPSDLSFEPEFDGVVVHFETVPGGPMTGYDQGKVAVHAVGHWLGLYHTFQGGCEPPGDEVEDTPPIESPTFGKPKPGSRESCLRGVPALTDNFMDYVDDEAMTSFTAGQIGRIKEQVAVYRPELLDKQAREQLKFDRRVD